MNLILFTASYPYDIGAEQTFLDEEIKVLVQKFDRVILVPRYCFGVRLPIPEGVEVDESYARFLAKHRIKALSFAVFSPHFSADIFSCPLILLNRDALKRLIKFVGKAELTRQWVARWFQNSSASPRDCIFYTYWFDDAAMGIGLAKKSLTDICVVSRAHGYDLYEERYDFAYWPCRRQALALLDKLFLASENGVSYMNSHYPEFSHKYQTAHLGVADPGFVAGSSGDGVFRIVSCSALMPVKRVDLLFKGLARAAELNQNKKIHWVHFGDGPEMASLLRFAHTLNVTNLTWDFPGHVQNTAILNHYKTEPVDLFANVSVSEGGAPVSIQEAISCSIPILATDVGGNPEIVSEKNGLLIPANPTSDEIAYALTGMINDPGFLRDKRSGSRVVWKEKFDAVKNFDTFSLHLKKISMSR